MITFYRNLLPLLQAAEAEVEPFRLGGDVVSDKLQRGIPLLVDEALPLDVEATQRLFLALCQVLERLASDDQAQQQGKAHPSILSFFARRKVDSSELPNSSQTSAGFASAASAKKIREAVQKKRLDLPELWLALLGGNGNQLEEIASVQSLPFDLLRLLGQQSLSPSLRVWSKQLQKNADVDLLWRRRTCPMCGATPLLGEIQGKEGARRLRCGACGSAWEYPRLQCAGCGTQNHRQLGYISIEGEDEKYRVQTCDQCRGYLKMVTTFETIPTGSLAIEDLQTTHLDAIATAYQFQRVSF